MASRQFIILTISTVFALCTFTYVNGAAANTTNVKESAQIQKIVSLISEEKYDEARDTLWKLPDPVLGMRLVTQEKFKDSYFQRTLSFLRIVDKPETPCKLYAVGMGVVIDETLGAARSPSSEDWFPKPTVNAQLAIYSQRWKRDCGNVTGDPDLVSVTKRFKEEVDKVIEFWAEGLRNGKDYVQFIADHVDLSDYMPGIVHSVYKSNSSNVVNTAQFVSRYAPVYWKAVGWTQLLKELQEDKNVDPISKPMMVFSHYFLAEKRVQQFAKQERGKEAEEMYTQVYKQIPDEFKAIFPESNCVVWDMAREYSVQVDKTSQGESKLEMRYKSGSEEGKWKLTPFIATHYEPEDDPIFGGKLSQLRFAVQYFNGARGCGGHLCVLTEMEKGGLFGWGKNKEKGSSAMCLDANTEKETTSTWQLEPVARGYGTVFRMVTANQDGPSYALHVTKDSELEVAQVTSIDGKEDTGYYWQLDCNPTS